MRPFVEAGRRLKLVLNPAYFHPEMNKALFNEALGLGKKSLEFNLFWLQPFLWRTLSRLSQNPYLRGDPAWQKKSSETLAALSAPALRPFQVLRALEQANRAIEIAHPVSLARAALVQSVHDHLLLSPEQEQRYRTLKDPYRQRNAQLNAVNQAISQIQSEYNDWRQRRHHAPVEFLSIPMELPRELFDYHIEKEEVRILTAAVKREIRIDKDIPALYQALRKKLTQQPPLKKAPEDAQAAQVFLNDKANQIASRAKHLKTIIQEDIQQVIEQRSQIIIAHAQKLEQLYCALDRIIYALESALARPSGLLTNASSQNRALTQILQQARLTQAALGNQKTTPEQIEQLQQHIQQLNKDRQSYTTSITSQRSAFFFRAKQAQRQQELQLNHQLQSEIANLINPLMGLQDVQRVIPNDEIHQKYAAAKQLEETAGTSLQEQKEVERLKTSFIL